MIQIPIYFFIFGYLFGLSLAVPPGPVNAIIANESLKSKLHGTSVGAGAMTADLIFFIIIFQVKRYITLPVLHTLYFIGGFYLLYLSVSILRSKMPSKKISGNFLVGLTMGLSNPFQITWWITVGLFMLNQFSYISTIGFFLGIITWITIFPLGINKFLSGKFNELVKVFSFLTVLIFAVIILFYAVHSVL